MTKEERAEKVREGVYKRQLAQINPKLLKRIQNECAAQVRENLEKHYGVGKYAPQLSNVDTKAPAPTYPTYEEWMRAIMDVEAVIYRTHNMTRKEEVKLDTNQAEVHTMALRRLAMKVTTP